MPVDLHTHSTASDGSEAPGEVVRLAAEAGLSAVALTDHDILAGIAEAREAAEGRGIELIPGVELSLDWSEMAEGEEQGGMHLVVLWVEPGLGPLQDRLAALRDGRHGRNARILERLEELGVPVTADEVAARAGDGSAGRPHIAAAMVEHGYVPDIDTAFNLYLGSGAPAYVGRPRLTPEEAIAASLQSGGVPILAHPHTLGIEDDHRLEQLLTRLAGYGLVGLETHHARAGADRRRLLRRMAERVGLLPSGGSDFHGTYKPGIQVGVGQGDLDVPDAFLDQLRTQRPAR